MTTAHWTATLDASLATPAPGPAPLRLGWTPPVVPRTTADVVSLAFVTAVAFTSALWALLFTAGCAS